MPTKVLPSYLTFEQALRAGYAGRIESRKYLDWVKTLPCVASGQPADDPHHPVSVGFKGGASKVPDYWCIPLTRQQHDELHHDVEKWEERYGPQMHHALMTLTRAIWEGVLR